MPLPFNLLDDKLIYFCISPNKNSGMIPLSIHLMDYSKFLSSCYGANITVVAKYLGHTKIEETLNTYTHLFNSALNEVVDLIDKLA